MKMIKDKLFIYGLYGDSGICYYVGQTCNPRFRQKGHYVDKRKLVAEPLTMRIIRGATPKTVNRLEAQIGRAYLKRGQASLSKAWPIKHRTRRIGACGIKVYFEGVPGYFVSISSASLWADCSPETIKNNIGRRILTKDGMLIVSFRPLEFNYMI